MEKVIQHARCLKGRMTHKHYAWLITFSSGGCSFVSLVLPQYNAVTIVLAALTNVVWVWGDHNV